MKQIEKLEELDKMPTSIIIRRLNQVIDSHNTQAGEERDWCHCGHSEQDGIHDDKYCSTSKQDPIDVEECGHETEKRKGQCPTCVGEKYIMEGGKKLDVETLIGEVFDIGFDRGYRKETGVIGERYEEIIKVLKQAIRQ